jgi:hypothetical protein
MYSLVKLAILASIFAPAVVILLSPGAPLLRRVGWSVASAGIGAACIFGFLLAPYVSDTWMPGSVKFALAILAIIAGFALPWLFFYLFRQSLVHDCVA